ncbi:MAG: DNA polymerase II large subunit, partial [Candidatus Bathyarchaeia archaeon]
MARRARAKGLDPALEPEPRITLDIADRVEQLVGPPGVGARIRELSEVMDRREMAFKMAEEVIYGRFGHFEPEKAADQALRTALAILTEGITIAPIQGVTEVKFKKNPDGSRYLAIYFAGPIRPAGGTAQALILVVGDFIRKKLGLDRYKPSEGAIRRFVEEVRLYERRIRRFQYHVTDEELYEAMKSLPVEATGVGTDPYEVSSFRNIPGIETNRVRGGALIVVVDGIIGRARKLLGICEKLHIEGWDFLSRLGGDNTGDNSAKFMDEIIVGRPVFSFPSAVGGFRLRYGRARNTGLAAVGVHPATMILLKRFLATGVQLRIELPGKSAIVTPVDSIEPPVIRLEGGSVVRVEAIEEAEKLVGSIEKILFVGDVLINIGDFLQNNESLLPAGYDESQWRLDLKPALNRSSESLEETERFGFSPSRLMELLHDPWSYPSPEEALRLSMNPGVPLHPRYTYLWSKITPEELLRLRNYLLEAERLQMEDSWVLVGALDAEVKEVLEKLLVPHEVSGERLTLSEAAPILEGCLALDKTESQIDLTRPPLEVICGLSGFELREKAPVFVGARMGRPEKSRKRMLSPPVHVLFPVGTAGGPQRDLVKATNGGPISVELVRRRCPRCGRPVFGINCPDCMVEAISENVCPRCGRVVEGRRCLTCNVSTVPYGQVRIDLGSLLEDARRRMGGRPELIKGVKGLMNGDRIPENLEKGVLRARYDLSVFKDGTIRFDLTDAPLTHFKASEVGVPLERLKELGYTHDRYGRPLESPEQMLELKVQDIIVCENCGDYLVDVARFLDDELVHLYGLEPFYRVKSRDDLVGALILGLAPHTSAAILGRIIGFTRARVCYAHPLWHAAKRRNCDGDEDAI